MGRCVVLVDSLQDFEQKQPHLSLLAAYDPEGGLFEDPLLVSRFGNVREEGRDCWKIEAFCLH